MAIVDEFVSTLELSSTFSVIPQSSQSLLSYNSIFRENGYSTTPAKWRLNICRSIQQLLQNKIVPMDFIMGQLQKYLNHEKYGFNGDLIIILAKYNAPINSIIVFRGIRCTLLHGIVSVCGGFNLSRNNESFHNYLIRNKPILDIKDEYGRTALVVAVWNLSKPIPNLNEVNVIRCLIEYGFNPFIKYRGITIIDKLSKIVEMVQLNQQSLNNNNHRRQNEERDNTCKAVQVLIETYQKINYFRQRVEAIQSSLKLLVHQNVIIEDVANVIQDCVGISHYIKRKMPSLQQRNKQALSQRIKQLSRANENKKTKQWR